MVLFDDNDHEYLPSDLACMNMLRHPVWVFDIDNKNIYWANIAAVKLFNAVSLTELLQRDFKTDMSEASANLLHYLQVNQLARNEHITDQWVIFPKDLPPLKIHATGSAVRIEAGRIAFLVEAELADSKSIIDENTLRNIEILKHLPIAVSQFSMDGTQLMCENPKASTWFGIPNAAPAPNTEAERGTTSDDGKNVSDQKVLLLQRFVDIESGEKALHQVQKNESFSAELQQYIRKESVSEKVQDTIEAKTNGAADNSSVVSNQQHAPTPSSEVVCTEKRWCNVMLRRTRDPVTSDHVILYIARDISDIIDARNESVQAAMKNEFFNVIAHEIRTPLHQIIGHVDLLEFGSELFDTELSESLQQIQASCSMLISIINDLLDCSKLENGRLIKEHISFDLNMLLTSCIESIRPQAHNKKLTLGYTIDTNVTSYQLTSDPNRLRQIIHNLLTNAVKFTEMGSVVLSVTAVNITPKLDKNTMALPPQLLLQFSVTDTGIGIDPKDQKIVFERYRQANASISRKFGGTGLGLPICKGLVELLGGTISLQSEIGKGTTVTFDVPFQISENVLDENSESSTPLVTSMTKVLSMDSPNGIEATVDTKGTSQTCPTTSINVLVVEDNLINQKVISSMLRRLGHRVTIAENGQVAVSTIQQKQHDGTTPLEFCFQLVLMDIQMPVMDGIECTKHIRNVLQYDKDQLPIIGLTAGYQPSDKDFYVRTVGMNSCIGKPLRMKDLQLAIAPHSSFGCPPMGR